MVTLTLAAGGIKLIEDVVAKESGPVDEAILWFIRDHVPAALNGYFAVGTFSWSARLLMLVAAVAATALLVARRRFEAVPASGERDLRCGRHSGIGVPVFPVVTPSAPQRSLRLQRCAWRESGLAPGAWQWRSRCCGKAWSPFPVSSSV